jgi:hypothetical protein
VQPGESPFVVSSASHLPPRLVLWRNGIKHHGLMLRHTCAHAAQRQRVRLLATKSEDDRPAASSAPALIVRNRGDQDSTSSPGDKWRGAWTLYRAPSLRFNFRLPVYWALCRGV